MTVSTAVKWAVSSMTGAPTLNGTAGSLIALLDAFLVNGFGTKAVDSATVTDGICRMAITGASAAQDHCVIQLAGVTGSGVALNGLQRVKAATASYVKFPCDLPDGPLTGTITFKVAPLGWEKVFSKTNVAVYRSTDPTGTRAYYRVDDTNALYARVTMYESMSDVDTGVAAGPLSVPGGYYWYKRQSAGASGVYWLVRGSSTGVVVCIAAHASTTAATANGCGAICYPMGDLQSYRSGDAWCAMLGGSPSASFGDNSGCIFSTQLTTGLTLQRGSHGLGGAVQVSRFVSGAGVSGGDGTLGAFPSRADHGFRLSPIVLSDGSMNPNGPRGEILGAYHCAQSGVLAAMGADVRITAGNGEFADKFLMTIGCGGGAGLATGCAVIDISSDRRVA